MSGTTMIVLIVLISVGSGVIYDMYKKHLESIISICLMKCKLRVRALMTPCYKPWLNADTRLINSTDNMAICS